VSLIKESILAKILAIAIFVMIIVVTVVGASNIDKAPIFNLVLLAGLIGVTTWYAYITIKIARATGEQAQATVKMAEEMAKPAVFPDFKDATFPEPGRIWFSNLGSGSAVRLEIKIAYSTPDVVSHAWIERRGQYGSMAGVHEANWSILVQGDRVSCQPELAERHPGNIGTAFAEYSDIYGQRFLSGWGYRCEKDSKGHLTLQPTEPIYPLHQG